MEDQEVLALFRDILGSRKLSYVEELVICHSWHGKRYREMAGETGYEEGYLRDTGYRLWQTLSDCLGYQITKKRLRPLLMERIQSKDTGMQTAVRTSVLVNNDSRPTLSPLPPHSLDISPEFPGSPLPVGSSLYVKRLPVEELATSAIQRPGGLLRIKAPWHMGKTSLMHHVLSQCGQLGYQVVMVDMRQADSSHLVHLDAFVRWFCWSVSQQLDLPYHLDDYWFEDAGSKVNCTAYMQHHILAQVDSPLVVAIDTGHYLLKYPAIAGDFFAMLRAWYEQARVRPQWQKLRLMLAHVTDLDLPLQAHQSPFNVGLMLELPHLSWEHVQLLMADYGLAEMTAAETATLKTLIEFVGGHPYLIQLTFYWLQFGQLSVADILQTAATNQSIYRGHLRHLWSALEEEMLLGAFYHVLVSAAPVQLTPKQAYTLADMGLVTLTEHQAEVRCELYRAYFRPLLEMEYR